MSENIDIFGMNIYVWIIVIIFVGVLAVVINDSYKSEQVCINNNYTNLDHRIGSSNTVLCHNTIINNSVRMNVYGLAEMK